MIEMSVTDDACLELGLGIQVEPARERPSIDRKRIVENEGACSVAWAFATVATRYA